MGHFSSDIVGLLLFFAGLAVLSFVLLRWRDRLGRRFLPGGIAMRASADLGAGARLVVVEIDGVKVLVGLDRNGVQAMQPIGPAAAPFRLPDPPQGEGTS
jgi:hypothetical protein